MKTTLHLIAYILLVCSLGFAIYACGLYYVNKTLVRSCEMHDTKNVETCMYDEAQTNLILKAYKG